MAANSEKLLEGTKALIQDCLADGVVDAGEVLKIGVSVAEKVAKLKAMSVEEKKTLALSLVEEALKTTLSEEQYQQTGALLVQVLPAVLEIAGAASRGELALGDLARVAKSFRWFDCMLGCLASGPLRVLVPPSLKKNVVSSVNTAEPTPEPSVAPPVETDVAVKEESSQASSPPPEAASETTVSPDSPPSEESQTAPNQVPSPEESRE